jgi:hypothetical protein
MDWLLSRSTRIEDKLAARHLQEGSMVLYDITSQWQRESAGDRDGASVDEITARDLPVHSEVVIVRFHRDVPN